MALLATNSGYSIGVERVVVWFRRDLRLRDNQAWLDAVGTGKRVLPVFILSETEKSDHSLGRYSRWWLHHALKDLTSQLDSLGIPPVLMKGDPLECIDRLTEDTKPDEVFWNRCYEPSQIKQERQLSSLLEEKGIRVSVRNSVLLVEPERVFNKEGDPFKVYSAFARSWSTIPLETPPAYRKAGSYAHRVSGLSLGELNLIDEEGLPELATYHDPTRRGAEKALKLFLRERMPDYPKNRDIPSINGTSRLSAYLHWGQIGPREIMHEVNKQSNTSGRRKFISELAWREFAYYILFHFPYTVFDPFRPEFKEFPWRDDGPELEPWQSGKTGFPIVDAGMRELAETGYMHNRVRMLVASLLVKHLMISWKAGAKWFWEHLVDADLANNTLGWQWTAGCGVDAAPYFRVFNPVLQGKKFDRKGDYVRKYVPELEKVPDKYIHDPWTMPEKTQEDCGCIIGEDYPEPVCGLMEGRVRALSAWKSFKDSK